MLQLTYIYHDCFLLRTDNVAIVFDYWKDPLSPAETTPLFIRTLPSDLKIYVVVSHFHKDHLNKDIFKWSDSFPNIHYVISKDVERHCRYILNPKSNYTGHRPSPDQVTVLHEGESFSDEYVHIDAFGSTDIGNSYAVTLKDTGIKIFHAGDLNCWAWRDESSAKEINEAEVAFSSILTDILKKYEVFDIVMFPVDSRIGTGYFSGAAEFVRTFDTKHFFPMHFELGDTTEEIIKRHEDAARFALYAVEQGEYIALMHSRDTFLMNNLSFAGET